MTTEVYLANPVAPGAKQTRDVLMMLELLGPLTVAQLQTLGVAHPPARIEDLRDLGYRITTKMVLAPSHDGRLHRIGLYILNEEACDG